MREACRAISESASDSARACEELNASLRSLKGLVGRQSKKRSYANLKRLGTAIILAPSPEPFTDVVGLALIGAGVVGERVPHAITLSDMREESSSLFKSLEHAKPFTGRSSMWGP